MSAASGDAPGLRRVVLLLVVPAVALCALTLAGNARADGSPLGPSAAAPSGAAQGSSTAETDQVALAGANATQEQPSNVVNSTRVDSPGDDGAITQANVAQAQVAAANGSATAQDGGSASSPGADDGAQLDAATQQVASAVASAVQQGAQNIVIEIRINSPGDNGPINQSNIATAGAGAVNASQTSQGDRTDAATSRPGGSTETAGSPSSDPAAVPAPPAAQDSSPPASAGLRPAVLTTAPPRPRAASTQETHEDAATARSTRAPAAGAGSAPVQLAPAPAQALPSRAATAPASKLDPRRVSPAAAPVRHVTVAVAAASAAVDAAGAARQDAARVVSNLAGVIPATKTPPDDVSSAVLFTVLALIVALISFVAYTYAPPGLRVSSLRLRLRP